MNHKTLFRRNRHRLASAAITVSLCAAVPAFAAKSTKNVETSPAPSPIDQMLADTTVDSSSLSSSGSIYSTSGVFADLAMDFRATRAGDVVTVVVSEQASAASQGATATKRTSGAQGSVSSIFGTKAPATALSNLMNTSSQTQLQGTGATSRQTTVSTTLSARVIKVLPNGNLIVQGEKTVAINSEAQTVMLRGIVRPIDIGRDNSVDSNRVADLEVRINGRGVVNDAIHRPNMLYRVLLGILPF